MTAATLFILIIWAGPTLAGVLVFLWSEAGMDTASRRRWRMDSGTAAILGAAIGAAGSLLATYITIRSESNRIIKQIELTEESDRRREMRADIAEVAASFGSLQQSMEWITWFALNEPSRVDSKFYDEYNNDVKQVWPRVLSSVAKLAGYDEATYDKLDKASAKILSPIDVEISKIMVEKKGEEREKAFKKIKEDLKKAQKAWRDEIRDSMKLAEQPAIATGGGRR